MTEHERPEHPSRARLFATCSIVVSAIVLIGSSILLWNHTLLSLQVAFAQDQTQIFEQMRTQALQSTSPQEIFKSLEYVVGYYASGTKQPTGTALDRVVERHRAAVVREIVLYLRNTTHEDLGDDPEAWIREFTKP